MSLTQEGNNRLSDLRLGIINRKNIRESQPGRLGRIFWIFGFLPRVKTVFCPTESPSRSTGLASAFLRRSSPWGQVHLLSGPLNSTKYATLNDFRVSESCFPADIAGSLPNKLVLLLKNRVSYRENNGVGEWDPTGSTRRSPVAALVDLAGGRPS